MRPAATITARRSTVASSAASTSIASVRSRNPSTSGCPAQSAGPVIARRSICQDSTGTPSRSRVAAPAPSSRRCPCSQAAISRSSTSAS
ncbi:hypothetical protein ACFSTI_15370 [Rhizorhabdus histidinilytica]